MDSLTRTNKDMYDSFTKSAAKVIHYFEGDERQLALSQLREEVLKLCKIEEQIACEKKISIELSASRNNAEANPEDGENNIAEMYKEKVEQISSDPTNNENLIEYDRVVMELQGLKGNEANNGDDAELQLTRDTVNVIDPVTKKRMTDPMRNAICGHVYDRESVAALLSQNPHTLCPVPGCKYKDFLSLSNMKSDIVTKTYLDKNPA